MTCFNKVKTSCGLTFHAWLLFLSPDVVSQDQQIIYTPGHTQHVCTEKKETKISL